MRRRDILLGTAALLGARMAHAQARPLRIGWMSPRPGQLVPSFHEGMRELGYQEGRSYVVEERTGDDPRGLAAAIGDLLAMPVDLFFVISVPILRAVAAASSRSIRLPLHFDFMAVSSYGASTQTSGVVRILKDLSRSIEGRDVIVVEDIIDTGLTLNYLLRYLRERNPTSIRICCLLDKPARRLADIDIDYRGFTIDDRFVIGYGLDFAERYRNLPYVAVLHPDLVPETD